MNPVNPILKVAKFGGSSLADAAQFRKVREIVLSDPGRRLVVVSASGKRHKEDNKITDLLYLCHAHLQYSVSCLPIWNMVRDRYLEIKRDLGLSIDIERDFDEIYARLDQDISIDDLVSRGEYLTARMMAEYLGFAFLEAQDLVRFDLDGKLNLEQTTANLRAALSPGMRAVLPGFYGGLPGGRIKVFSRGGSDISGALLAMAAQAGVYENWTDVSGIMMADPRIVEAPRRITQVTYSELRELAYMGANVMHEGAIYPVKNAGIPINIRNTNDPDNPGTMILQDADVDDSTGAEHFITGIAGRRNFSAVSLYKTPDGGENGMVRRALEIFERYRVEPQQILSSIDSVSFFAPTAALEPVVYDIVSEIKAACELSDIQVNDGISLIAVVGRNMSYRPGVSGRLFGALGENGINIRMISQGSDEINIIVGVENRDFEKAVRTIYDRFGR